MNFFQASRVVRHGDPLSPALFTILFDLMSRIITKVEEEGKIKGVRISNSRPTISHLIYVDDLVIYGRATIAKAQEILNSINLFCSWIGQDVNLGKYSVHFSRNIHPNAKHAILQILQMEECNHKASYLGLPFCKSQLKREVFG